MTSSLPRANPIAKSAPEIASIDDLSSLNEVIKSNPDSPNSEEALARIVQLVSHQIQTGSFAKKNAAEDACAASVAKARATLGNTAWIKLVPPELRDELLADLIAALDAMLEEATKRPPSVARETPNVEGLVKKAIRNWRAFGFHAALHGLLKDTPRHRRSATLDAFAVAMTQHNGAAAIRAYWLAYACNPSPEKASKVAQRMFKSGDISSAGALIKLAGPQSDNTFAAEVRFAAGLFESAPVIPRREARKAAGKIDVGYVASSSIAHQVVGYTVRTQSLLSSLNDLGLRTTCFVRPGYPWDRSKTTTGTPAPSHRIGGVSYLYSKIADISDEPEGFLGRMADALVERFQELRPGVVHAASNYRNALPALVAARRVGLPFVYEVRGLWELSAASRIAGWEQTERFALERSLELKVASAADQVLTITEGVAAELAAGGVSRDKIAILPNGVDPGRYRPMEPDEKLVERFNLRAADIVLVYCGSMVSYEGLDDLIEAVGLLRDRRIRARLIMVGDGNMRDQLRELVKQRQLQSRVTFVGTVPADEVHRYWSLATAVALPRKPFKVCEVVSPLKPFEAMAMSKPVILSDLPVSREIVEDGSTGFLSQPANPFDLAAILERLATNPTLGPAIGKAAREWVAANRSWDRNARLLSAVYSRLRQQLSGNEKTGLRAP